MPSVVPFVLLIGTAAEVAPALRVALGDAVEVALADVEELLTRTADAAAGSRPVIVVVGGELSAPVALVHAL